MKDETSILASACRVILWHLGSESKGCEAAKLFKLLLDRATSPDLFVYLEVYVVFERINEGLLLGLDSLLEDWLAHIRELFVGEDLTAHPWVPENVSHSRSA